MLRQSFIALFLLFTRLIALEITGTITGLPSSVQQVAIAPDGQYGYISNLTAVVNQFDTSTLAITRTITVGNGSPAGIAITPGGRYAYVARSSSGIVNRIDLFNNYTVDSIMVSAGPQYIAISPDGMYAYVTCQAAQRVDRIEVSSSTVTSLSVPVTGGPLGIAVTPDSRFAYVTNVNNVVIGQPAIVTKIDLMTFMVASSLSIATGVGAAPSIAISPDGAFAYLPSGVSDPASVTKIDLSNFTVYGSPLMMFDAGPSNFIVITNDGAFAYVSSALSSAGSGLVEIDLSTFSVSETIATRSSSSNPRGLAISPNQQYLYQVGAPLATTSATQVARFPGAPRNLTGVQKKNSAGLQYNLVNELRWQAPAEVVTESGYNVYRNGVKIASLVGNIFSYNDSGVQKGAINSYYVTAVSDDDEGPPSNTIQVP